MDDTRNVTQYCQEDIDQQIATASALEEDTKWWEDDGKTVDRCVRFHTAILRTETSYMILQMSDAVKGMMIGVGIQVQ